MLPDSLPGPHHFGQGRTSTGDQQEAVGQVTLIFKGRSSENWSFESAAGDVLGGEGRRGPEGGRKGLPLTVRSLGQALSQLGGCWTSPRAPQGLSFPSCQMTLLPASGGDQRD